MFVVRCCGIGVGLMRVCVVVVLLYACSGFVVGLLRD